VFQVNVLEPFTATEDEEKYDDADGADTDVKVSEPVRLPPLLEAVTVHVPEPVVAARTLIEPLVPLPEPEAAPEQETEAEVAPLVFQVNVVEFPLVRVRLLNDDCVTVGAGTDTVRFADLDAEEPAALVAVTVQEPVPDPDEETEIEPLVPDPEPEAGAEQETDAEVAPLVAQLNVEEPPLLTDVGENVAEVTLGAATVVRLRDVEVLLPTELAAVTVQVPEPTPEVDTVIEPLVPDPLPDATPEQETDAELALDVAHVKVVLFPEVTVVDASDAEVMTGAATPVPEREKLVVPPPLCTKEMVPGRAPVVLGVNETVMEHVPLIARVVPQVLVWPKSVAPVETDTPEMVSGAEPLLVTVTD
jgi:hypothetical protein